MHIKGYDKFKEKAPRFSGWGVLLLPLFFIFGLVVGILVMVLFNRLPEVLNAAGSGSAAPALLPLAGYLVVAVCGYLMVYQMWAQRLRFEVKYGAMAYQRILPVGLVGVALVLSLAVHMFIPYWHCVPAFWADTPLRFLTVPMETYAGAAAPAIFLVRMALAALITIAGLLTIAGSFFTFGLDYMILVYLYFPEEGEVQDHRIYSVLRHPAYAGALTVALGGLFFTLTPYSIIFFLVYLAGFSIHVRYVEERELIQRFGPSYRDYARKVPAFFNPGKAGALLRFLLGGR